MRQILCNYYVTYRCNASCGFCEFKEHGEFKSSPHASLDDFKANLPHLKKAGVRIIDLTGGEPLLNPALPEMLKASKDAGFITTVTSNGLLYPKQAEKLRGLVDLLHFSLDSFDPDLHNKIRGVNCYNHVMLSVKTALDIGEKPDIIFTVTRENIGEIEAVYRFTRKLRLILILNPVFEYFQTEKLEESELRIMEQFAKRPYVYLSSGFVMLRREGGNQKDAPVCKAVTRVVVISPRNELLLPCYHKSAESIPISGDLTNTLDSELHKKYRLLQGALTFCHGCTVNCYFEPSFALGLNRFTLAGISGKIKYTYTKYLKQGQILRLLSGTFR